MTGKEFKEYLEKTLKDDDTINYIIMSGECLQCDIEDLEIKKEDVEGKTFITFIIDDRQRI